MPRGETRSRHGGGGAISIVGLRKEFDGVTAVDGIDLEILPGEFFTLLGPSGCGKTTTLRMLGGFEQPTGGQILLDGVDVAQTPAHKRPVNTVFQSYALFPHLDVQKNVAYARASTPGPATPAWPGRSSWSGSPSSPDVARTRCPAGSSSEWRWPAHWSSNPRCCSWTSRWVPSTRSFGTRCARS
jgi:hypothetical protein